MSPTSKDILAIDPIGKASGTVVLPGSKSISNRALLLAALSVGKTKLTGLLKAEDTERMLDALAKLGVNVSVEDTTVTVNSCGEFPNKKADIFVGNAGTVARMLTAALAFADGEYTLDGVARMRERPIGDLVDALVSLGANITYLIKPGFLPIAIAPAKLKGNFVRVRGNVSSQFLTALLLMAPVWAKRLGKDFQVEIDGPLISLPYVQMTTAMMASFGAKVSQSEVGYTIGAIAYTTPNHYAIEADASAASYFLALGALTGGPVRVMGVGRHSLQGDVCFADSLETMGATVNFTENSIEISRRENVALSGIHLNCLAIPDAAMTFVPMALKANTDVYLEGIGSWRVKETDRLEAMAKEVAKFGARVESGSDWIRVAATAHLKSARVVTYNDHRMAMSFALAACAGVRVEIENPGCTAKTFPNFFETLFSLLERKKEP